MAKKKKNPYVSISPEQLADAEANYFVIQIGHEFFVDNGKMSFKKNKAENIYFDLLEGIGDMLTSKDEVERQEAFSILCHFRLIPVRVH